MDLKKAMRASISEVLETMFFLTLQFEDQCKLEECGLLDIERIYACKLDFKGKFSGYFTVFIPEEVLIIMAENFMGEERDNLTSDHIEGTIKEVINMVAGSTFSNYNSEIVFNLGIPKMIKIDANQLKKQDDGDDFCLIETTDGFLFFKIFLLN
ncbi:MAG: chemotaxis protein CheX [Desulfobacterales bacterium]|nr:chemotaxis protein CheX [Desulfobacterales bacterium]